MPDNTTDITPDEPAANDPGIPVGETTAAIEPEPIPSIPEPTNMEVHHHAHAAHGKKTWKDYFWEFLMLFLAVFCGFLAEYQLEHSIEKQRAKEFASSLKTDLKKDTTVINNVIFRLGFCAAKIDTLVSMMKEKNRPDSNLADFYAYNVFAFIFPQTTPDESTLQQLLNSGSLRYFKNEALVDSIKYYNTCVQSVKRIAEASADFNIDFRKQQLQVVEISSIVKQIAQPTYPTYSTSTHEENVLAYKDAQLLTQDAEKLDQYRNWCNMKIFYINNNINNYRRLLQAANGLLRVLEK
ncbi:MAG: hypothetical protein JWQ27_49 [Ferruginibacter sp.]|nr:hypothetical protein [Ferruginibacter sp.]